MNAEYVQYLYQKLERRKARLEAIDEPNTLQLYLGQFLKFLDNEAPFSSLVREIAVRYPNAREEARQILTDNARPTSRDELEHAAVSLELLRQFCGGTPAEKADEVGRRLRGQQFPLKAFASVFLTPVFDYLEEQLDEQTVMLGILGRYKTRCEWFEREELLKMWEEDKTHGETLFQRRLYKYLHDQGWDFTLEPSSPAGRADFLLDQRGERPTVADTKVFGPDTRKSYLKDGFRQLYDYATDHNVSVGYLVVFKTCDRDVRFALPDQVGSTPYVVHNGKTIFIITIDVCKYEGSASKRGRLTPIEVRQADLVGNSELVSQ